jgi:hypothetical protein
VAESACLESTCAGNGTVGSNPTLSAIVGATETLRRLSKGQWRANVPTCNSTVCVTRCFSTRQGQGAGPCATGSCEPRQVRKEATVSRPFCVPQDHLAPFFEDVQRKSWFVIRIDQAIASESVH